MTETAAIELARHALATGLIVCAPVLLAGLVVGVAISIVLAATQIQEFTLTFLPKLAAMALAAVLAGPWMLRNLVTFARWIIAQTAHVGP